MRSKARRTLLNPVDLICLSVGIENVILPNGDLEAIPGKEPALLVACHYPGDHPTAGGPVLVDGPTGALLFFHHAIPPAIRQQVQKLPFSRILDDIDTVRSILGQYTACTSVFRGAGCYFDHIPAPQEYRDVVWHSDSFAILVGGNPVSRAWTQDSSDLACELAVESIPAHRGHGYARQVCAAWAAFVIDQGKVAFYSYKIGNLASQALARSLNVVQYARTTGYA